MCHLRLVNIFACGCCATDLNRCIWGRYLPDDDAMKCAYHVLAHQICESGKEKPVEVASQTTSKETCGLKKCPGRRSTKGKHAKGEHPCTVPGCSYSASCQSLRFRDTFQSITEKGHLVVFDDNTFMVHSSDMDQISKWGDPNEAEETIEDSSDDESLGVDWLSSSDSGTSSESEEDGLARWIESRWGWLDDDS